MSLEKARRDNRRFVEDDDRGSLRRVDRGEHSDRRWDEMEPEDRMRGDPPRDDRRRDEMEPEDRPCGDPPRESKTLRGGLVEPADYVSLKLFFSGTFLSAPLQLLDPSE